MPTKFKYLSDNYIFVITSNEPKKYRIEQRSKCEGPSQPRRKKQLVFRLGWRRKACSKAHQYLYLIYPDAKYHNKSSFEMADNSQHIDEEEKKREEERRKKEE